jgi:hypothetical protein
MNRAEADELLSQGELVVCAEGALADAKRLMTTCLEAGIPAAISAPEDCASGKCAPKLQVLVRTEDTQKVVQLLRDQWLNQVEQEGMTLPSFAPPAEGVEAEGEPPCPACGTAAPLVEGACSDCGLQLE